MGKILYVPLIILPSMPDNVYTGTDGVSLFLPPRHAYTATVTIQSKKHPVQCKRHYEGCFFYLKHGFAAIFALTLIGNLATGSFKLGFQSQPVAHSAHL